MSAELGLKNDIVGEVGGDFGGDSEPCPNDNDKLMFDLDFLVIGALSIGSEFAVAVNVGDLALIIGLVKGENNTLILLPLSLKFQRSSSTTCSNSSETCLPWRSSRVY
jgi:hypothetical protein